MNQRCVVKVGGAYLNTPAYLDSVATYITQQQAAGQQVVLVHGGGNEISQLHATLQIPFEKKQGLRVTTPESMELVTMVLCGLVNKRLVAHLNRLGMKAVGISGVDFQMMQAPLVDEAIFGRVGGAPEVSPAPLINLLDAGHMVILAPVCTGPDGAPVNVNADIAAQAVAVALSARCLDFVTDVAAVRTKEGAQATLYAEEIPALIKENIINGGMRPKLEASIAALNGGVQRVRVGNLDSLTSNTATEVSKHKMNHPIDHEMHQQPATVSKAAPEAESATAPISPSTSTSTATPISPTAQLALADQVLAPTYKRPELLFVKGEGAFLQDHLGQNHLDMTSGVAVNALGHQSPVIIEALRAQLEGLVHTSNLFHTSPAIELAAALTRHSFADKVFFCNSGAEATEGAIKFARLFGGKERRGVVYFDGSFHGRTMGALSATDREKIRQPFTPLPEGYTRAQWNEPHALDAITAHTAAVIVEPIQGEGGIRIASSSWLKSLRARCDELGVLLIFDEVQSGLGRTGKLWAYEHFGVTPDLMTLAKPLAGGLPMGAVLMTNRVAEAITPGCHATTFGGGPLVASVANAVFREISAPDFLAEVRRKGQHLVQALERLQSPHIQEIRGYGLFVGVRLSQDPAPLCAAAREEGLLLVAAGEQVIRFLPPLNVEDEVLRDAVARFSRAIDRWQKSEGANR